MVIQIYSNDEALRKVGQNTFYVYPPNETYRMLWVASVTAIIFLGILTITLFPLFSPIRINGNLVSGWSGVATIMQASSALLLFLGFLLRFMFINLRKARDKNNWKMAVTPVNILLKLNHASASDMIFVIPCDIVGHVQPLCWNEWSHVGSASSSIWHKRLRFQINDPQLVYEAEKLLNARFESQNKSLLSKIILSEFVASKLRSVGKAPICILCGIFFNNSAGQISYELGSSTPDLKAVIDKLRDKFSVEPVRSPTSGEFA